MDNLIAQCATVLETNPQPYAVASVKPCENGAPPAIIYEYLNPAMSEFSGREASYFVGKPILDSWPEGDGTWDNAFCQAALHGESVAFDFVSTPHQKFMHGMTYPLAPGYCVFSVQDATFWVSQAHTSLKAANAGLFFFDSASNLLMLSQSVLDLCGLDTDYLTLEDFVERLFGPDAVHAVQRKLQSCDQLPDAGYVLIEGQLAGGRWLQLSMGSVGQSGRFSYGMLEDVTRRKTAELRSARHMRIVESLGKENFALYLVDLDKDTIVPYRTKGDVAEPVRRMVEQCDSYTEAITRYLDEFIDEEDREVLAGKILPDAIRANIERGESGEVAVSYKRRMDSGPHYQEVRIIRRDDESHQVVLAARGTNDEVAEQMRQKQALQAALATAEHANQAKSTFLTNMSHDFRTPMNSISGFANIALESVGDDAKVRDCLEKILLSSEHLLNLVNDILDVSRIESGRVELSEEEFSLQDVADELQEMFEDEAAKKRMQFEVDTQGLRRPMVCSDQLRIMQILVNIVGNAFKFTPQEGLVRVEMREQSDGPQSSIDYGSYLFTVRDSGIGMAPEFLEVLFDPFERAGSHSGSVCDGTGLGMTITKNLVDLLGGTIRVESQVGEGSVFTVVLPLRWAKGAPETAEPEPAKTAGAAAGERDFSGFRVLVVDDDMFSREIVRDALERRNCLVEDAEDGSDGVEMVRRSQPGYYDAIIMDMRMPKMNGDEAARAIRALDREDAATIPIVAATADAFAEAYERAREAGMDAHITKPLNTKKMVEVLAALLLG